MARLQTCALAVHVYLLRLDELGVALAHVPYTGIQHMLQSLMIANSQTACSVRPTKSKLCVRQ